jgi:hypothetical protein
MVLEVINNHKPPRTIVPGGVRHKPSAGDNRPENMEARESEQEYPSKPS